MDNKEMLIEIEQLHDSSEELIADAVCPCGCGMCFCVACITDTSGTSS